jgi:hypothetical protein
MKRSTKSKALEVVERMKDIIKGGPGSGPRPGGGSRGGGDYSPGGKDYQKISDFANMRGEGLVSLVSKTNAGKPAIRHASAGLELSKKAAASKDTNEKKSLHAKAAKEYNNLRSYIVGRRTGFEEHKWASDDANGLTRLHTIMSGRSDVSSRAEAQQFMSLTTAHFKELFE